MLQSVQMGGLDLTVSTSVTARTRMRCAIKTMVTARLAVLVDTLDPDVRFVSVSSSFSFTLSSSAYSFCQMIGKLSC